MYAMRKIFTQFKAKFLILLMLSLSGCNSFLNLKPEDKLIRSDFWRTKEDALSAVIGTYSTLRDQLEYLVYWGEVRGEFVVALPGKGAGSDKESVDVFLVDPSNVITKYVTIYSVINQANLIIKNAPLIIDLDPRLTQKEADEFVGEARFLRAYCYFLLTRTFKEVPLQMVPAETDDQNYNLAKSKSADIIQTILDDLKFAQKSLPISYASTIQTKGRATKYAACSLRAEVELWNDNYQEALNACNEIINSNRFGLLPVGNYSSIYYPGNTIESLWEFQYSKPNNQTNSLYNWFSSSNPYFNGAPLRRLFDLDTDVRLNKSLNTSNLVSKYSASTSDAHWILYRYSDILLLRAEALTFLTGDMNTNLKLALEDLNDVRKRSDLPAISDVSSRGDMAGYLLDERGRELCFEGKRWFDLMRFGKRNNFEFKSLLSQRVLSGFNGVDQQVISMRISNPESWYFPLNADDVANNNLLVQNPFYNN
jgi:hypothetical protein